MSKLLDRFSTFDLVLISLMACMGIATKPIIVPIAQMISSPLFIPGGALAGGLYMMWMIIGARVTGKVLTATLTGFTQGIVVIVSGFWGSHGILSLLTYTAPGLAIDLMLLAAKHRCCCLGCCFAAGMAANSCATFLVNLIFFNMPLIPMVLSLAVAALSGGIGGLIAFKIVQAFPAELLSAKSL